MSPLSFVKPAIYLVMLLSVGAGGYYLINLKASLEIEKQNVITLEKTVEQQKAAITNTKEEVQLVIDEMKKQIDLINESFDRINVLNEKIEAERLSRLSRAKPAALQKLINRGTKNAMRCMEIVSGSPLTKQEMEVTKLSQANRECQWIHPNLGK